MLSPKKRKKQRKESDMIKGQKENINYGKDKTKGGHKQLTAQELII